MPPEAVLEHIKPGADIIMPNANGEPVKLVDALEEHAEELQDVRIHQMHALRERRYINGEFGDHLRYVSYFLAPPSRKAYLGGQVRPDAEPFQRGAGPAAAPHQMLAGDCRGVAAEPAGLLLAGHQLRLHGIPDREGAVLSGGQRADAAHVRRQPGAHQPGGGLDRGRLPANRRSCGGATDEDQAIAALVAERIPDGATIQAGIGGMPNALLAMLKGHKDLGVHTELLSDGVIDLVESGVVTGIQKKFRRGKIVTTLALGSQRLYDFLHENSAVDFAPVDWVNDPRVIAREPNFVAINATTEVDFYGQCASETVAGKYFSSSGGQYDFSRGAMYSESGQGFIVLQSTTRDGSKSKIRPTLTPGSVVTTSKNTVDKIVTEYGVAEMRGKTLRERARALIAIARPQIPRRIDRRRARDGPDLTETRPS